MPQHIRNYQIYFDGHTYDTHYKGQAYLLDVRATSLRQAIFLAASRRISPDGTNPGIVSVDHRDGPEHANAYFTSTEVTRG